MRKSSVTTATTSCMNGVGSDRQQQASMRNYFQSGRSADGCNRKRKTTENSSPEDDEHEQILQVDSSQKPIQKQHNSHASHTNNNKQQQLDVMASPLSTVEETVTEAAASLQSPARPPKKTVRKRGNFSGFQRQNMRSRFSAISAGFDNTICNKTTTTEDVDDEGTVVTFSTSYSSPSSCRSSISGGSLSSSKTSSSNITTNTTRSFFTENSTTTNASSMDSKNLQQPRNTDAARSSGNKLTQVYIDVGQSNFGILPIECKICGMMYDNGNDANSTTSNSQHSKHCQQYQNGVQFTINTATKKNYYTIVNTIPILLPYSKNKKAKSSVTEQENTIIDRTTQKQRIEATTSILQQMMMKQRLTKQRKRSTSAVNKKEQTKSCASVIKISPNEYSQMQQQQQRRRNDSSSTNSMCAKLDLLDTVVQKDLGYAANEQGQQQQITRYVCIVNKRIVGAIYVESVQIAHELIVTKRNKNDDKRNVPKRKQGNTKSSDTMLSYERTVGNPKKVMIGIQQVWVHERYRRQGIATVLLDTVCDTAVYGCTVSKQQIAFSSPTQSGITLAMAYCYGDDGGVSLESESNIRLSTSETTAKTAVLVYDCG